MDSSPVLSEITTSKKLTKDAKNSSSSFITKMHQILQDPEIQHLINWNSDGTAFQITHILKFSNTVLPKYFKHRNYSSFVRQLNMYGFRKVKTETAESSFSHENFTRDEVAIHKIKRLKMKKNQSDDEDDEHFIEKYSGSRRTAAASKTLPNQNTEFQAIHEQLSQLTDKFKLMQDTTNDLRKTVLSQNDTIKTLMTELLQARIDGEKKFKTLVSDLSTGIQSDETYADLHEQVHETKTRNHIPTIFDQDLVMPKANTAAPKFPEYFENLGLDNILSNNGGNWYKNEVQRELNNGPATKKSKLNANQMLSASREAFNPFNQMPKGRNGHSQGKSHYYESVNPYPYLEKSFQASHEQNASSYELSRYEAQKLFPELIQELCSAEDDQERYEEQHYQPHKKIQKVSLRNGVYPINGEAIQSYH